jgi:hypothetical protein
MVALYFETLSCENNALRYSTLLPDASEPRAMLFSDTAVRAVDMRATAASRDARAVAAGSRRLPLFLRHA